MQGVRVPDAPMTVPQPLGPGDDDGKDRGVAKPVAGPLGPGDDDGKDRGTARAIQAPAAPGDGPEPEFQMVAFPPLGPGDPSVPRPAIRRPLKKGA